MEGRISELFKLDALASHILQVCLGLLGVHCGIPTTERDQTKIFVLNALLPGGLGIPLTCQGNDNRESAWRQSLDAFTSSPARCE